MTIKQVKEQVMKAVDVALQEYANAMQFIDNAPKSVLDENEKEDKMRKTIVDLREVVTSELENFNKGVDDIDYAPVTDPKEL